LGSPPRSLLRGYLLSDVRMSWCIRRNPQVLGRGDKWASASLPSLSELNVPLTAQHLHDKLLELKSFATIRCEHKTFQLQQLVMKMLDCERYIRFGSCWFERKMV
jgi:hypothetical protein